MKGKKFSLFLVLIVVLAVAVILVLTQNKPSVTSNQQLCEDAGGRWMIVENSPYAQPTCNLPTSDAGQVCTDSSECESYCQAEIEAQTGSVGEGTCHDFMFSLTGCAQTVEAGIVQTTVCQ